LIISKRETIVFIKNIPASGIAPKDGCRSEHREEAYHHQVRWFASLRKTQILQHDNFDFF
jgi:hypothetical protein